MEKATVASGPEEKGNPVITTLFPQDLFSSDAETAPLRVPAFVLGPNTGIGSLLDKNIACFTVSGSLKSAAIEDDYKVIQEQAQNEWLKVGGLVSDLSIF
jgi:hypothetical protein